MRPKLPQKSIQIKTLLVLLPLVVAVLAVAFTASSYIEQKRFERTLQLKQNQLAEGYAALALAPLANRDKQALRHLVHRLILDPDLLAVRIADDRGLTVIEAGAPENAVSVITQDIVDYRPNQPALGSLTLFFGRMRLEANLISDFKRDLVLLFCFVAAICGGVLFAYRQIVGRPLALLLRGIRESKEGRDYPRVEWTSQDEFGQIIRAFNDLQDRLERHQRKQDEHQQQQKQLLDWVQKLQGVDSYKALLELARQEVSSRLGYEHVWLHIFSPSRSGHSWRFMFSSIVGPGVQGRLRNEEVQDDPLREAIFNSNEPVVIEDARTDPRTRKELVERLGSRTLINMRLTLLDQRMGIFGMGTRQDEGCRLPDAHALTYLSAMAEHLTATVDRLHFNRSQQEAEREKRQLQEQVFHAQKLESLGLLTGGVAHDFNNLMTGVLGNASLARNLSHPEDPTQPFLTAVETAAQRAADLAQQMLAYSGKGRFLVEPFDLSPLVTEVVRLLRVSISKKISIEIEALETSLIVEGDPTQIRQVIMNLLTNAAEAIGDKVGQIQIVLQTVMIDPTQLDSPTAHLDTLSLSSYRCVVISDTGIGMSREVCERIFDPFFSTKRDGRGLGMATVLGIIRSHHGTIQVESEPGQGTSFRVLLPSSKANLKPPPEQAIVESLPLPQGKILVVDDEEIVRELATIVLREAGYEVETAVDGLDALERFNESPQQFSAVILDMSMPRLDGEETYRRLRAQRANLPILLSSGRRPSQSQQTISPDPLLAFLAKPYRASTLEERLAQLIQQAQTVSLTSP